MRTAVIALTKNGAALASRLARALDADIYLKQEYVTGNSEPVTGNFTAFVGKIFNEYEALVFVMASGIVVRAIAPFLKDKRTDPAVVVMDEKGKHSISLLSGHIGGANELAHTVAAITGGTEVITTSTDVNEVIAFDVFAVKNDCVIENINNLRYISSELVNGGKVALYSDFPVKGRVSGNVVMYGKDSSPECVVILSNRSIIGMTGEKTLMIRPRNLVLGIGCKRGTSCGQIKNAVLDFMERNNRSILSIKQVATIDVKKDEQGLLQFCSEMGFDLHIIDREAVKEIENNFTGSGFVKEKVGVSCVAEPCAVLALPDSRLVCSKTVYPGITLALSEEVKEYII